MTIQPVRVSVSAIRPVPINVSELSHEGVDDDGAGVKNALATPSGVVLAAPSGVILTYA